MSLNYCCFLFYKHFREGSITKYRKNRPLQKKSYLAKVVLIGRYQGDIKSLCRNFWNFHFFNFMTVRIFRFCQKSWKMPILDKILNFGRLWNWKKWKFQISPHIVFVSPWNLPIWTKSAQSDWQFSQIWSIYAKNGHSFYKGQFPCIS